MDGEGEGGGRLEVCGEEGAVEGGESSMERARHHFQRRWPEAVGSGAPRMWLHWEQWMAVVEVYVSRVSTEQEKYETAWKQDC